MASKKAIKGSTRTRTGAAKGKSPKTKGKVATGKPASRKAASKPAAKKAAKKPAAKKPAAKRAAAKKAAPKKAAAKKAAPKKAAGGKTTSKPRGNGGAQTAKGAAPPPSKGAKTATKDAKAPPAKAGPQAGRKASSGKTPKQSLRRPEGAEELKVKIGALASAVSQIRGLKRGLNKNFYEIGQILREIETKRLYEVKGYGSFEAFVDREIDLGKQLSLRIVRIVQTFLRDAALRAGLERVSAALQALDGEEEQEGGGAAGPSTRSAIPAHKQ